MNLDDLKESWQRRNGELAGSRFDEVAAQVRKRAATFQRQVLRRDLIETAAAVAVIAAFSFFLLQGNYPWIARLGMAVIILGTIEIAVVLHWTRSCGERARRDLPLAKYCAAEIARVKRQIRLLRHVTWWYTGPILLGACIFFFGLLFSAPVPLHISVPGFAALCMLIGIFGWIVHRINQRAVTDDLIPLRDELAAVYASLAEDSTKPADADLLE